MSLDTRYQVETPEGIELHADIAGPVPRSLAYAIDLGIRGAVLALLGIVMALVPGEVGLGVWLLASFLFEWFYPVVFEVYRGGQTPGKRKLGLAVVNEDLTPVRWDASLMRNLLRAVDFMPFSYLAGLTCMCLNQRFQRLGDIAAGTLVVHRGATHDRVSLPDCRSIAPPVPLGLEDQIAVINFTQRHAELSSERQRELANILTNVVAASDDEAVLRLRGIGAWLLGGR